MTWLARITRPLPTALAAAFLAGVATILALAAAADAWTHDGAIVLIALAAVFIAQGAVALLRPRGRGSRNPSPHPGGTPRRW
ncbi:hypothetical protein [Micromonospora sp. DT227]|uniref:hypothetical protein n=1 Tax=Micromonospora sp. DT227 TaxID=3393433 RepID=UPI003CF513DD